MSIQKNYFASLFKNKDDFIRRLLHDNDLVKCLINKDKAFLKTEVSGEDVDALPYKNIFPYRIVDGVQTKAESYICMGFKYNKVPGGNYFKYGYITFFIFCHESLVRTSYGMLRYDFMLQRIDSLLNDSRGAGWFGKLELYEMSDFILSNGDYIGVAVTYKNVEAQ